MNLTVHSPFTGNYSGAPSQQFKRFSGVSQDITSTQSPQLTFGSKPSRSKRGVLALLLALGGVVGVTSGCGNGSSSTPSPSFSSAQAAPDSTSTQENGTLNGKALTPIKVYTFKDSDKNGNPDNWGVTLPWNDHFNKATGEEQYYDETNILIKDNILKLVATDKAQGGQRYTSAIINQPFEFSKTKPTYIEATLNLDSLKGKAGMWPAFWVWPSKDGLPELDGMEMFGNKSQFQTNLVTDWGNNNLNTVQHDLPSGGFYKFGIEVSPQFDENQKLTGASVQYYLTPENEADKKPLGNATPLTQDEAEKLLSEPAHVIVNLALGSYAGTPDPKDLKGSSALEVKKVSISEVG